MLRLSSFLIFIFAAVSSSAQWQAGFSAGIANYQGDLTDKVYVGAITRGAFGLHLKYEVNSRLVLRGGATYAKVAGADKYISKDYLKLRNLSFESGITELSLSAELHTFHLENKRWSPYLFGGLAVFHFNPYVWSDRGNKIFLKPLSTEGQGLPGYDAPYSLTHFAMPFGGGLRYNISDKVVAGFEIGLRKLFTDHLDDISGNYADAGELLQNRGQLAVRLAYRGDEVAGGSPNYPEKGAQRGSPAQKDYYYISAFHLSFRLGEGGFAGGRGNKKSGYGCPVNF